MDDQRFTGRTRAGRRIKTAGQVTVTVSVPGWGTSTVTADALDAAIADYLPASPAQLRKLVTERGGGYPSTDAAFARVTSVAAFLVMLADWDHNIDDDPLRVE